MTTVNFASLLPSEGRDVLQQELEKQVYQAVITKHKTYLHGKKEALPSFQHSSPYTNTFTMTTAALYLFQLLPFLPI